MRFIKQYFPHILLTLYLVEFVYFSFEPFSRSVWLVENLPVLIAVAILVVTFKKFRFSNLSYFLMAFFLMYHTFGGHHTFALAPFELGNTLLDYLNMEFLFPEGRNNFDRVGHYFVGIFAYPVAEFVYRKKLVSGKSMAVFFGIIGLGFWAALYEIIETVFAVVEGGDAGLSFLGSQGDIWDAQKDMLLDILGAITASVLFLFTHRRHEDKKELNN